MGGTYVLFPNSNPKLESNMEEKTRENQQTWAHVYFAFLFTFIAVNTTFYSCVVGYSNYHGFDSSWVSNVPGMKEVMLIPECIGVAIEYLV